MDEGLYKFLKWTAIALASGWVGWSIYDSFVSQRAPGDFAFHEAENFFEDGAYDRAIALYDRAIEEAPQHIHAMRGRARAMLKSGRYDQALEQFDIVIGLDPELGATYANRGIVHDYLGHYEKAVADYEKSLSLDPELAEGPHWLTRFLRNQPERPPGIADRARYLRAELAKPPGERLLRVPELDEEQRSYKQ